MIGRRPTLRLSVVRGIFYVQRERPAILMPTSFWRGTIVCVPHVKGVIDQSITRCANLEVIDKPTATKHVLMISVSGVAISGQIRILRSFHMRGSKCRDCRQNSDVYADPDR